MQSQTTVTRPSRARKPATAPFSATAARLIEQIQAEAREQLLTDLSAKDAIIVLHGFDAKTKSVRMDGDHINVRDGSGNSVHLHRNYKEPESWRAHDYMQGHWHPSRWYGDQTLVDANGTKWQHSFDPLVCDDFGNLVQVPA